jgi:hypothetical protein
MEAAIILRYATLMYDETENYDHMEAILSKGVSVHVHFIHLSTNILRSLRFVNV